MTRNTNGLLLASLTLAIGAGVVVSPASGGVEDVRGVISGQDGNLTLVQNGRTVEVTVNDGKVTARVDGKKVPEDRIRRSDGRVTILDADGNPLEGFQVVIEPDEPGSMRWRMGEPLDLRFEAEPLPVMLGITMSATGPALVKHLGLDEDATTIITGVYKGLPAYKAGIREHDIIVSIDGEDRAHPDAIREVLRELEAGDTVRLEVIQSGKKRTVRVELVENDPEALAEAEFIGSAPRGSSPFGAPLRQLFPPDGDRWRDIIVAPDADLFRRLPDVQVNPDVNRLLEGMLRQRERDDQDAGGDGDLQQRLEAIDERMAELESMLQKLLERMGR